MSQPGPFDQVLQIIATTNHYAIGDFLADLFRVTGRSERHGKMLGFFFRGQSTYGVGEVLKRLDMIAGQFAGDPREHQYTLDTPYESLKSGRAALTSYAAQKVHDRLLAEQDAAVDPNGGLHVFAPHKKTDSEPINLRLSWDTYGATTFNDIQAILMKHQPLTFNLVHRLAIPERHDPSKEYRYRPPKYVTTQVLSQINYSHNRNTKRLQVFNGILLLANGATQTVLDYTSRLCLTLSYNNIFDTLKKLSEDEARKVRAIGRDQERCLDLTFDNVQAYAKQWEMRIGRESVMRVGLAATAVELTDFDQEAVDLMKRRQLINQGRPKKMSLNMDDFLNLLNKPHNRIIGALHWLQILTAYIPELESYKGYVRDMFRTEPPASMRLDRSGVRRTVVHPLATSAKNEASSTDLRDGLTNFLDQIGQTPDDHYPRIVLMGGDGMTFEQLGNLKQAMQRQDGPFKNFEIVQPYLQLWHTEWTDLSRLFTAHFGEAGSHDPSTIGHNSAKIGFKRPANLAKIDYYPGSHHLYRILDGQILDCWRQYFRTDNLWAYFSDLNQTKLHTPDDLYRIALLLYDNYSTPKAAAIFGSGSPPNPSVVSIGEPWREEEDTEPKPIPEEADDVETEQAEDGSGRDEGTGSPEKQEDTVSAEVEEFDGDHTLMRSSLLMYEAIVSKEVAQAVAEGDVGRVYEGIKLMLFTFAGSSHNKYTSYLLDTITFLEFDAGPKLRDLVLRNWLVNLSGEPGRYIEKDLMQEHHNDVLENRIKRGGIEWDSRQMRDIHSRMVHHAERIKKEMRSTLELSPKGWKHPKPHDRPEIKILLDQYRMTQLHTFRKGRRYRSSARFEDEFARGVTRLPEKLKKWKADLAHSDLTTTMPPGASKTTPEPNDTMAGDDEELLRLNVHQLTEGHREFVNGELCMVDDEEFQRRRDEVGVDDDEDER